MRRGCVPKKHGLVALPQLFRRPGRGGAGGTCDLTKPICPGVSSKYWSIRRTVLLGYSICFCQVRGCNLLTSKAEQGSSAKPGCFVLLVRSLVATQGLVAVASTALDLTAVALIAIELA